MDLLAAQSFSASLNALQSSKSSLTHHSLLNVPFSSYSSTLDNMTMMKKQEAENEKRNPLFLNKTFAMLKNAPKNIATWSDDGLSFYIIDQTRFVESVIPQYFKHSNFASFVRQLNFYGFRKIWSDTLIDLQQQNGFEKILEFKHQYFQRDNPDLMSNIRKTISGADISKLSSEQNSEILALKADVEELKVHVYMLTNKLVLLSDSVAHLVTLKNASAHESMLAFKHPNSNNDHEEDRSTKKARTT